MTAMYSGSKGPVAIDTMPHKYLASALAKLLRDRADGERQDEVDAMTKRLAVLDEEFAAKADGLVEDTEPKPALAPLVEDMEANPRAVVGGNAPPVERPFDLIREHMEDLLVEAHNWADGATVETQAQVDEINRLKDDLRKAAAAAEAEKEIEKGPLDLAANEIQARYNVYLAPTTNKKVKGKIPLAIEALSAAQTPFLQKRDDEIRAAAAEARRVADEKAAAAAEAVRQAQASDLTARESAEDLIAEAETAAAAAKRAEATKAQAHGGVRATGLKSFWNAKVTNPRDALLHYLKERRPEFDALAARMAQQDIDAGKRQIPGVEAIEERRVA